MSTLPVYDSEEEDSVVLLVGGVEAPLLAVHLGPLHSDVGAVHDADAVSELSLHRGCSEPGLLLSSCPPADTVG